VNKGRAVLESADNEGISIELVEGEQAIVGQSKSGSGQPDYDLSKVLSPETLEGVGSEHATLAFREGSFWVQALGEHETQIGKMTVVPGHLFRLVDRDRVRFGEAEFIFRVLEQAEDAEFEEARYR
jgi:hypothetical protein